MPRPGPGPGGDFLKCRGRGKFRKKIRGLAVAPLLLFFLIIKNTQIIIIFENFSTNFIYLLKKHLFKSLLN